MKKKIFALLVVLVSVGSASAAVVYLSGMQHNFGFLETTPLLVTGNRNTNLLSNTTGYVNFSVLNRWQSPWVVHR